jgi:carboxyl-terminal processing protease
VLNRAQIQIPSVNSSLLPGDVGYVELVTFGRRTSEELHDAIVELKEKGAKTLVMDLRNNGGGYLSQARGVAELFLPEGKLIVSTKSRVEEEERLYSRKGRQVFTDEPLIVLVNGNTASASEIVSGACRTTSAR